MRRPIPTTCAADLADQRRRAGTGRTSRMGPARPPGVGPWPGRTGLVSRHVPGRGCGSAGGTTMLSFRRRNLKPASCWPGLPAPALRASRARVRATNGIERFFAHLRLGRVEEVALAVGADHHQADVRGPVLAVAGRDHVDEVAFLQLAGERRHLLGRRRKLRGWSAPAAAVGLVAGFQEARAVHRQRVRRPSAPASRALMSVSSQLLLMFQSTSV